MHYDTTTDLSYKEFVSLQSEHCNELSLQPFSHINKNRCEYCTESQNKYDINAVNILSTQLYYSSTDTNYNVTLYEINTSNNNLPNFVFLPKFVLKIPFRKTSIEQGEIINVPDIISQSDDLYQLEVNNPKYSTVDNGIDSISSTETNKLNINIYSNISTFNFDLSNLITENKFDYLSLIDITFDATYVNQLNIYDGINITMNNIGDKYLRSLNNINIYINNNVFFHNGVSNNKLIKILSHKTVTHTQTITIFEDYDYDETTLYLDNSSYNSYDINKNINKLIIVVNSSASIDLGKVNKLHYLKDIILIITVSDIELTITGSLSQKCNIIIFNNNDDQSSFVKDDIENYPKFYERPTLLSKNPQNTLLEIPLPVQASLLIYKFEYNANVEPPIEPIFNLEYDKLPFFNQYNVEFNGTDTFLKNDKIDFTIEKISFWFYLQSNIQNNVLLSLYNDNDDNDKYLTVMISNFDLVIKTNFFPDDDIIIQSSPLIYNYWYYIENLFDFTDFAYNSYITEAEKLPTITLNIGNVQSESIRSNFSESIQSHCKIGNLKLYKNENENNFKKYLDFSESPVYQANFIQYKFNCNIEPEKNKYNENEFDELPTFTSARNIQSSKFFITFTAPNTLEANIDISCLSIWFKLNADITSSDAPLSILSLCNEQQVNKLDFKIDIIDSGTYTQYLNIDNYDINIELPTNKWFNLVLYKNYNNNYKFYVDNVEQSGVISAYNLIDCILLQFNSIQLETADLRLYNELLIDSNLLSGIYYDNEILKYNSLRYRFGDNSNIAENNNSSYKLSESLGNTLIYNEYYVSFKENGYLQLENSYNTKLLSISFCLNTINSNDTYHLISLSNVNNCNLEFFIHDFKLSSIQDSKITTIKDYIHKDKWYNLILEEQNKTKIYIDNYSNNSYDYSLNSLNYLRIGNISNIVNIANIDTIHSRLFSSTELTITGTLPSERNGHTMVVLNNKIYIFGGFGLKSDGQLGHLNDFYEIDIEQSTSTELNITGTLPTKRHQHTMVVLNDKIYIFGGYGINSVGVNSWLNDFYEIDIEQSTSTELTITITGTLPTKRHQHTMVVLNNKIYIFGGFSGINGVFSNFNNFYEIDIEQSTSTELTITGTLPSARNEHTMVVLNNKIYIFGGFGGTHLNNFYKIDIEQSTSTELNISGTLPTARKEHTMVVTMDNKIYIFGGYGRNSNGVFSYLNDSYKIEIDSDTVTSTELTISGTLPPKRSEHTMVVLDNKIYIFGGIFGASISRGNHLNDFHELTFTQITNYYQFNGKYDQFDGKIADLQLYNSEYLNTSIDTTGIYSNLLYYKP